VFFYANPGTLAEEHATSFVETAQDQRSPSLKTRPLQRCGLHRQAAATAGRQGFGTRLRQLSLLLAWVLVLAAPLALADEARLEFAVGATTVASFDLDELNARIASQDVGLFDPEYGKQKHYRAFPLHDVLRLGLGPGWADDGQADIFFQAIDGYRAVSPVSQVAQDGGFLVFRDLDVEDWEPVGRMQANPAPFYLVWTGANQTTQHGYPWPWQLALVQLAQFDERYPQVPPKDAAPDSPASRGFALFKQRCVRCHSINGQGGVIGPDLNAPMSILSYRSIDLVKAFIRHPSLYRHTRMPDHADLSEQDLDALIAYFWHKSREPRPE